VRCRRTALYDRTMKRPRGCPLGRIHLTILQIFLFRLLSRPSPRANSLPTPQARANTRTGGGNRAARVFDVRPIPHFERRVSHSARNRAEGRQEWGGQGTGGHPLKGQRCSFGRQPSLGPRRMRWAVGEAVSLATPALCMSRQEQTLCHSAEVGRDDSATEATPASYRRWGEVGTASFFRPCPPMALLALREHRAGARAWGGGGARLGCRPHRHELQDVGQRLGEVPTKGQ
jgi:hypothetical protein